MSAAYKGIWKAKNGRNSDVNDKLDFIRRAPKIKIPRTGIETRYICFRYCPIYYRYVEPIKIHLLIAFRGKLTGLIVVSIQIDT
jgi:hypothetical protein